MKRIRTWAGIAMGAGVTALVLSAALAQGPKGSAARDAGLAAPAREAKRFPDLPPTPPDWEFVQQAAFSRFPHISPAETMRFLTANLPFQVRGAKNLSLVRPDDSVERLTDLIQETQSVMAEKTANPRLYEMRVRQMRVEAEIERWTEASRTDTGGDREKHLAALRRAVEESFDIKQELMKSDVEQLEKKLLELKGLLGKRQESRTSIVALRMTDLTRGQDVLKW